MPYLIASEYFYSRFKTNQQGIRNHKYVPKDLLLEYPGEIDLSAYVNFAGLGHAAQKASGSKIHLKSFQVCSKGIWANASGIVFGIYGNEYSSRSLVLKNFYSLIDAVESS
jgi:Uncharacterized conserved protein